MKSLDMTFKNVEFTDENHTYKCNNMTLTSTTTLLKKYQPEFNKEYWLVYTALKNKGIKVRPEDTRRGVYIGKKFYTLDEVITRYNLTKSIEELTAEWDDKRVYGVEKGNAVHAYLENRWQRKIVIYKGYKLTVPNHKVKQFEKDAAILIKYAEQFYQDYKNRIIPIRAELVIGDEEYGVAGQIDLLAYDRITKEFIIFDYKTDKEINGSNKYDKLKHVLSHLDACELVKYSLQTGIYKELLEKNTDIKISKIHIVWFNVENDNYKIINTIDLTKECKEVLNGNNNKYRNINTTDFNKATPKRLKVH